MKYYALIQYRDGLQEFISFLYKEGAQAYAERKKGLQGVSFVVVVEEVERGLENEA